MGNTCTMAYTRIFYSRVLLKFTGILWLLLHEFCNNQKLFLTQRQLSCKKNCAISEKCEFGSFSVLELDDCLITNRIFVFQQRKNKTTQVILNPTLKIAANKLRLLYKQLLFVDNNIYSKHKETCCVQLNHNLVY